MPLREDQKSFIREEIKAQLEERVRELAGSLNPKGWKKLAFILRQLGPIIGTVAVILALAAITIGALYQSFAHVEQEVKFRTQTENDLTTVKSDIKEIEQLLAKQDVLAQAALPLVDFQATLPGLSSSLIVARKQQVIVPSQVVNNLSQKLIAVGASTPGFWPTASELVNYKSYLSSPQKYATIRLPNCDPHPARDLTLKTPLKDGSTETATLHNALTITQENCFLDLDEHNVLEDYICHNCVVKYSGGLLTLKSPVEFKDCLFMFSIRSQPATPSGKSLAEALLSQSPQDVKIPAG
jgi:hypothetical protein